MEKIMFFCMNSSTFHWATVTQPGMSDWSVGPIMEVWRSGPGRIITVPKQILNWVWGCAKTRISRAYNEKIWRALASRDPVPVGGGHLLPTPPPIPYSHILSESAAPLFLRLRRSTWFPLSLKPNTLGVIAFFIFCCWQLRLAPSGFYDIIFCIFMLD